MKKNKQKKPLIFQRIWTVKIAAEKVDLSFWPKIKTVISNHRIIAHLEWLFSCFQIRPLFSRYLILFKRNSIELYLRFQV